MFYYFYFIINKIVYKYSKVIMSSLNNFLDLEKIIGTEGAFNILMVENEIRKSFFEALRFSTILKLNKYMKKYKILLEKFKNIDIYIFEIDKNDPTQIIVRFMVYQKKYEKQIKKIKSYKNHKEIGYMLDYSCPSNYGKGKVGYSLILNKDKPNIYQHNWIDPNKVNILKQTQTQLFNYVCSKDEDRDYKNISIIGKKCMDLIRQLKLPYEITITINYNN